MTRWFFFFLVKSPYLPWRLVEIACKWSYHPHKSALEIVFWYGWHNGMDVIVSLPHDWWKVVSQNIVPVLWFNHQLCYFFHLLLKISFDIMLLLSNGDYLDFLIQWLFHVFKALFELFASWCPGSTRKILFLPSERQKQFGGSLAVIFVVLWFLQSSLSSCLCIDRNHQNIDNEKAVHICKVSFVKCLEQKQLCCLDGRFSYVRDSSLKS